VSYAAGSIEATAALWARLSRPFDVGHTVEALLGLPSDVVDELAGVTVATCAEAEALLAAMPRTLRNLRTAIGANHERCVGELRGPVQWSATIAAQASSLGNRDVFVCASPERAFDIEENRVLVGALRVVSDAGSRVESASEDHPDDVALTRARHNTRLARRYLDHRTLDQVRLDGMPSRRAVKRTRGAKHAATYRPALDMLERAAEPLELDELAAYCDRRTRAQHGLLAVVLDELERRGLNVPALRAESGSLFAGPVEYIHPRRRGADDRLHGVLIGSVLVDVPDVAGSTDRSGAAAALAARSHGRHTVAVIGPEDVPDAVDQAIRHARM